MKTSVKAGWIVTILMSTIILSFTVAQGSDDWYMTKIKVQPGILAVYEYVPASQTQIIACWVGTTAFSILVGIIAGLVIYNLIREEEKKHE